MTSVDTEDAARKDQVSRGPRLDVQGLRAIAVLSVIANHLWDFPRGGFVGVDVFFVLSGYLITGLLIREHDRTGRISYASFYRRRVRRIIPAATIVIVTTVAATYYSFNSARGAAVAKDGVWAFFFASNWHFADVGTDYFRNDGLISPLQHYWSLAVEEQFYIVWPTLLVAVLVVTRRGRGWPGGVLGATALVTAASFAYSLWHTGSSPTTAYFSTFDRAWELGVGAVLAVAAPSVRRLPAVASAVLGWAGLTTIVASFWAISETSTFPAPWAALPVLGTAAVIAAGEGRERVSLFPLTNRAAQYIGDISYSLYLWHFPVIIVLLAYFPDGDGAYAPTVLGTTAIVSALSFHLVEDPVRRSQWLEPRSVRRSVPLSADPRVRTQDVLLACLVLATVGLASLSLQKPEAPATPAFERVATNLPDDLASPGPDVSEAVAAQQAAVRTALSAREFPSIADVQDLTIERWDERLLRDGCLDVPDDENALAKCRFGTGAKSAVVLGDSYAMAWMPGIRAVLEPAGYSVQQMTLQQCPVWNAPTLRNGDESFPQCADHRDFTITQAQRLKPDLLILATSPLGVTNLVDRTDPRESVTAGMADTLTRLQGAATRTVILSPPPNSGNLQTCMTRSSVPDDCVLPPGDDWVNMADGERDAAAGMPGVEYADTKSWFCASDLCPAFTGSSPIRADGSHLTWDYSESLAPLLQEVLLPG